MVKGFDALLGVESLLMKGRYFGDNSTTWNTIRARLSPLLEGYGQMQTFLTVVYSVIAAVAIALLLLAVIWPGMW